MTTTRARRTGKPGAPARFDRETARARKSEQTIRGQQRDREILMYVEEHHPKIFQKARDHAEHVVATSRGPLPGDG